jgi:hypothetical protein
LIGFFFIHWRFEFYFFQLTTVFLLFIFDLKLTFFNTNHCVDLDDFVQMLSSSDQCRPTDLALGASQRRYTICCTGMTKEAKIRMEALVCKLARCFRVVGIDLLLVEISSVFFFEMRARLRLLLS